jgi:hypothetical protein
MVWIELKHQIHKNLKRKNINMSMAKISNYLTNRGCIYGTHKFGSKAFKGFKGLRYIEI